MNELVVATAEFVLWVGASPGRVFLFIFAGMFAFIILCSVAIQNRG